MKQIIGLQAAYNVWANKRIAEILKGIDSKLLDKEVTSSFPSLRKTVYHIWDAEYIWLRRLQGESISYWPSERLGAETAIDGFLEVSGELLDIVRHNDDEWLNEVCENTNLKGDRFVQPKFQVLMHVLNHSTFHRGQLVTILRNLGVSELVSTDLITYLRQG